MYGKREHDVKLGFSRNSHVALAFTEFRGIGVR